MDLHRARRGCGRRCVVCPAEAVHQQLEERSGVGHDYLAARHDDLMRLFLEIAQQLLHGGASAIARRSFELGPARLPPARVLMPPEIQQLDQRQDRMDTQASKSIEQNKRDRAWANNILLKGVIAVKIPGITVKYEETETSMGANAVCLK